MVPVAPPSTLSVVLAVLLAAALVVGSVGARSVLARLVVAGLLFGLALVLGVRIGTSDDYARWREGPRGRSSPPALAGFDPGGDPARVRPLLERRPHHPFPERSPVAARQWKQLLLRELQRAVGWETDHDPGPPPATTISEEVLADGVVRQLLAFEADDGTRIPAYLCRPAGGRSPRGALLLVPGHGRGIVGTAGFVDDYQNGAGVALARAGYLTLTAELRGFGRLGPALGLDHRVVAMNALRAGSSYRAVVLADLRRAVSVLLDQRGVAPERVGVAGASLGGEIALMLAVLDERVRAVAVHSVGRPLGPVSDGPALHRFGERHGCHVPAATSPFLLLEDWYRLAAPLPLLVVDGDEDLRGLGRGADHVALFDGRLRDAYRLLGAWERVDLRVVDGGHEFFVDPMLDFLAATWPLRSRIPPEAPSAAVAGTRFGRVGMLRSGAFR